MFDPFWGKKTFDSPQALCAWQGEQLSRFVRTHLYPFSPYYRQLFEQHKISPAHIRSFSDLKHLPFTTKADFVGSASDPDNFRKFILQPTEQMIRKEWPKTKLLSLFLRTLFQGKAASRKILDREYQPLFITFTTGTTSRPVPFVYTDYDIKNLYLSGERMIDLFGLTPGDRAVNIFPYAPHLAFWQVVLAGLSADILILSTGGGKVMTTEGNISAILKTQPQMILGVPSYVYHVLRQAEEEGRRMPFVKKIVLGASKVSEVFKRRVASLLETMGSSPVAVFGTYGFTEARMAWAECPSPPGTSSGYHLYPDKEIFEVIDPETGEVKGDGEDGELVYTSIDSRGSSLLRYRTGDYVRGGIKYDPCPYCQRRVPRISSDITRLSDIQNLQFSKIKGSLVNLNHFEQVLAKFDMIKEWQIEICKKNNDPFEVDELFVYACPQGAANLSALEEAVKKSILLATEISPNRVFFVSFEEILKRLELETASKEKRVVDRRPKGS